MTASIDRVILIVLDSLGIGAAQDADRFGDQDANTLGHVADWCAVNYKEFSLPNLSKWGLGHLSLSYGLTQPQLPQGAYGVMEELSPGKDTTTGHWEFAGNVLEKEFPIFKNGFSQELLTVWCKENSLPGVLGNRAASGTEIMDELGEEHLSTGKPIVYTSGDSVFQIAWSEEKFGLEKLYELCRSARKILDPLGVGRVIGRPFVGKKVGEFRRTENRRDFSVPPPQPNLLDVLVENGCFVAGIGKIEDIFAHRSVTMVEHTGRNETTLLATLDVMKRTENQRGLIFSNLIDFDQHFGHRRDPEGYAKALMAFDEFLPQIEAASTPRDLIVITADHGNDPTHKGTDHTRENVPLLMWSRNEMFRPHDVGMLKGFFNVARVTLDVMGLSKEMRKIPVLEKAPPLAKEMGLLHE